MFVTVLVLLAGLLAAFYFYMTRNHGYFSARGLAHVPPVFPWGSETHRRMVAREISFVTASKEIYDQYKNEKLVGHYEFGTPRLLVTDLELAKAIMIKDFDHFTDRRSVPGLNMSNPINKIHGDMLTFLKGEKWKLIRSIYSPIFTSGKLKSMTGLINKAAEGLSSRLSDLAESGEEFSAKQLMSDFTMDVIASCGFGIDSGAFHAAGEDSEFRRQAAELLGLGRRGSGSVFRLLTILSFPRLAHALRLSFLKPEPTYFFRDLVRRTIRQRRENKEEARRRNDLIDLALDALRKGPDLRTTEEEEEGQFEKDAQVRLGTGTEKRHLSEEELESLLVANAIQLFMAGYETTSTILAVTLFHLARDPEVQERAREEVDAAFESGDGRDLDYRSLQQRLPYLEAVLQESCRTWPLTVVERECVREYRVPGTDFAVPPGMLVQLPTLAIMADERHFGPDAGRFDPENFADPERRAARSPYAFLAFGQGPRNCAGMRFAMLQMKAALAKTLRRFVVTATARTAAKLEVDPLSPSFQPKGGIWIAVERRRRN